MTDELDELYQSLILDHNRSPRNRGPLAGANCCAEGYNPLCGDHVTVSIRVENGVVKDVKFEGSGCAISTASASLMTETLKGKTLEEAKALFEKFHGLLTGETVEDDQGPGLGKLAVFSGVCKYPSRVKCATLAWHTVHAALAKNGDDVVSTE
jgi:nitrogen fixation NifU-like protein